MTPPLKTRPVRPRDAASLVLIDERGAEPRVLMGRRHARMAFIPDAFVFPGGKLDRSDFAAVPAKALPDETLHHLRATGAPPNLAQALAMAAVRETHEETGLFVAGAGDIGNATGHGWDAFRAEGVAPRLDALHIMARAITPTDSPIRFHARFFTAPADAAAGTLRGSGELSELYWYPVSDALKLPVIDVTEFVLHEILAAAKNRHRAAGPPLYSYRNGKPRVQRG